MRSPPLTLQQRQQVSLSQSFCPSTSTAHRPTTRSPHPSDRRLHFTWFPNPGYLVCKIKPPLLQQKVNTIHQYPAKLLTPTDAASRRTRSGLPRDVLRRSRTPPELGTEGTVELQEEDRLAGSQCLGGGSVPRTETAPGKKQATEAHPKGVAGRSWWGGEWISAQPGGLPHPTPASHRVAVPV